MSTKNYEEFESKLKELKLKLLDLIPEHTDKFSLFTEDSSETMVFNIQLYSLFSSNYDDYIKTALIENNIHLNNKRLKVISALVTTFINFVNTI